MMTSKKVAVSSLHYNPHRDVSRNPMSEKRIQSLMDSIERNDLWRGIVVRPVDDGYQLAFGHHRLEAIIRLGIKEIDVDVAKLNDAQMLQHLSDENLNQGGNSPAAALEIVVGARKMLDQYLRDSDTPEEFCVKANIDFTAAGGSEKYDSWGRMKKAGTVGRDILCAFLCTESHSHGWANVALAEGIKIVDAEYAQSEAEDEMEEAEESGDEEAKTKAKKKKKKADQDVAYRDIIEMFPYMENATLYVRELKRRADAGKALTKSEQMKYARKLIDEGTGKRDIGKRLAELIKDTADWKKEQEKAKKKREADKKRRQNAWKERWKKVHSITPDQYVKENLGLFSQMETFLKTISDVVEHIEDEEVTLALVKNCAAQIELCKPFAYGLATSKLKEVG